MVGDSQITSEHFYDARQDFNGASIPLRTKFKPSSVILRRFDYYELSFPGKSPGFVSDILPSVDFGDLKFDRIYICISNVDNLNTLTPQQVQFQAFQNASRLIHFLYTKLRHIRSKLHLVLPPPVCPPSLYNDVYLPYLNDSLSSLITQNPYPFLIASLQPPKNFSSQKYSVYSHNNIVQNWYKGREQNLYKAKDGITRKTLTDPVHLTLDGLKF